MLGICFCFVFFFFCILWCFGSQWKFLLLASCCLVLENFSKDRRAAPNSLTYPSFINCCSFCILFPSALLTNPLSPPLVRFVSQLVTTSSQPTLLPSHPICRSVDRFLEEILVNVLVLQRAHLTHSNRPQATACSWSAGNANIRLMSHWWAHSIGSLWTGHRFAGPQIQEELLLHVQRGILVLNEVGRDLHGQGIAGGWQFRWSDCCGPLVNGQESRGRLAGIAAAVVTVGIAEVAVVWAGVRGFCNR